MTILIFITCIKYFGYAMTSVSSMAPAVHRHLLQFQALLNVEEHGHIMADLESLVGSIEAKFNMAEQVDVEEGPGTAEVQIVAPIGILQISHLSIHEPAAENMRTSLKSIGKEAKGIFIFMLGTTIIEEGWSFEKLGVTAGSKIEVTVLDSLRPCFEWGFYDPAAGNKISDKGSTFARGAPSNGTSGVRTTAALPRDTLCYVRFQGISSHADLGVGTRNCKLSDSSGPRRFKHVFGQDENSWALCLSCYVGQALSACHKGQSYDMQDLSGALAQPHFAATTASPLVFSFLISASGQMLVTLPGHSKEIVVPFEIPEDTQVFVVASTALARSSISISSSPFSSPALD